MIACQVFSFLSALFCVCVICEKQLAHGDLLDQQGCNFKKEKKKEKKYHTFHKSQPDQCTLPVANRTQSLFAKYETIFFCTENPDFPSFYECRKVSLFLNDLLSFLTF